MVATFPTKNRGASYIHVISPVLRILTLHIKGEDMTERVKEGVSRDLTFGEILLARDVFGYSIRYHSVKIHCDSYFPFWMQPIGTAMAPNGELWFRKDDYHKDFSEERVQDKHTFIHEMAHVWQRQQGMWVRARGTVSWAADYHYTLGGGKKLKDYSMEQQASIIADYWLLSKYGYDSWLYHLGLDYVKFRGGSSSGISSKYQEILSDFIKGRYR